MLTAPELTLVFLGVVVGLGAAFVWMFWEIEQASEPREANASRLSNGASHTADLRGVRASCVLDRCGSMDLAFSRGPKEQGR